MDFGAPPDAYGEAGTLTPEDAFVAAVNTCIHMMFIWSCERMKIQLLSYECLGEGYKKVHLDGTEEFERVVLRPRIVVRGTTEARVRRALESARKYSLVAASIRCPVEMVPEITVES
jgi:organic hydroperoxide reductase OsmC/OhrA